MKRLFVLLCAVALLVGAPVGAVRADEQEAQLQALIQKVAPAIVTVKLVLKSQMRYGGQSQDQESRLEMQGVVVDKDGLVMISNLPFSPSRLMNMFGGAGESGEAPSVKVTPTDIKVVIEQEEKEYPAFLAATDTKLDLAFVQIEGLGERKLPAVEFASAVAPTLGQEIVSVSRLKRGFDYAPYFSTARVSSAIAKPRKAWAMDGRISEFGLPVFTLSGETIGVVATVESGVRDPGMGADMGFGMMMRLLSGGLGLVQPFVVPGNLVSGVIGLAKQQAVTKETERVKARAQAPPAVKETKDKAPAKPAKAP